MTERGRQACLSIPCRHRHCHAISGQKCFARFTRRQGSYFHNVRRKDAVKVIKDQDKLRKWNELYANYEVRA